MLYIRTPKSMLEVGPKPSSTGPDYQRLRESNSWKKCFISGQSHHPCSTFKFIVLGKLSECGGWANAKKTITSQLWYWYDCGKFISAVFALLS